MAFRFPLQSVFHFRQSVEHQQEMHLRAGNQRVARVRHLLAQLDASLRDKQVVRLQNLERGMSAAELHFALMREAALDEQREVVERELARLEELRNQQQSVYRRARQERENIESLRDRQLNEYERERARRRQRQLDDLFLLRQSYLRRG